MWVWPGATRFIAVAATSTLLASITACGGKTDSPGADPSSNASPATSASPTGSTAASQVAALEGGQVLVPADWTFEDGGSGLILQPPKSSGGVRPGSGAFRSSSTLAYEDELDAAAEVDLESLGGYDRVQRLPDVRFGGVTFYHIQAEDDATWVDKFVAIHNGRQFSIRWLFTHVIERKRATELINQVMPTFKPTS